MRLGHRRARDPRDGDHPRGRPPPRGAYCGALGWVAPGGDARSNVTIRTLSLYPGGRAVLNVGGGVVADSTAAAEGEEALWKARFAHLT